METTDVTITVGQSEETIALPEGVLEFFADEEQPLAATVGDLLTVDCTQRLHGFAHHVEEEPEEDVLALEADMREQFEERFGASFEELTGHQH